MSRGGADLLIEQQWARVRGRLRAEVGEAVFRSWLKPLTLTGLKDTVVRLSLPTRFMRDWVQSNYGERIALLWREELDLVPTVEIIVKPARRPAKSPHTVEPADAGPTQATHLMRPRAAPAPTRGRRAESADDEAGEIEGVSAPLNPRLTFETFVVGQPNELAHAAAVRVAEADQVPFNPLFLYSGVGLGKTHLMHAIAWHIRSRRPKRRIIFLSADQFMYQFVRALRTKDTMAFKELFRSVDVLMVDDVQFMGGREATQDEFFHTFNALVSQNCQVVVSADKVPSDLEGVGERLRSRLGWGLVADIYPTTYELRLGILQSKAELDGLKIQDKVLEFLAYRITSNVRELEGALTRIAHHGSVINRPVTLEDTQTLLRDLLRANDRRVTIEEIQKRVADHYNIRIADMHSARRARAVARPRQVAMYLSKQLTPRSLPEIARKFGRDHTTVIHAVRRVEELKTHDPSFAEDVELLRRMLEG